MENSEKLKIKFKVLIERSGFEPWPGALCCVLGQDT